MLYTSRIIAFKAVPYVYDSIGFAIYPKREGHLLLSLLIFLLRRIFAHKISNQIGPNPIRIRRAVIVAIAVVVHIAEVAGVGD